MLDRPLMKRVNAICRPSGDQAGHFSLESGVLVNRRKASPFTALIQMSAGASGEDPPSHEKATKLPSGDSDGSSSAPGIDVTVSSRGGADPSDVRSRLAPSAPAAMRATATAALHHRRARIEVHNPAVVGGDVTAP